MFITHINPSFVEFMICLTFMFENFNRKEFFVCIHLETITYNLKRKCAYMDLDKNYFGTFNREYFLSFFNKFKVKNKHKCLRRK